MSEQQPSPAPKRPVGPAQWRLIAWAAVAVYAVAFLLLNNERTDVSFVFFTVQTRLIWLILLSMGLGAFLMYFGPRLWRSRRQR